MMILDRKKEMYKRFRIEDLYEVERDEDGLPLDIVHSVSPKKFGIDPSQFYL